MDFQCPRRSTCRQNSKPSLATASPVAAYSDTSDVIRVALRQLQHAGARRRGFAAMLAETRTEADRDGTPDIDVIAEADSTTASQTLPT
jgi:hypothetical protein